MKHTLQQLEKRFSPMTAEQKASIIGGTGLTTAQLQQLFNYSSIGFYSTVGQAFTQEIQTIYGTKIGADVLNQMLSAAGSNPGLQIALSGTSALSGTVQFDAGSNTLDLGSLAGLSNVATINSFDDIHAFTQIAQQIYRAYEKNNLGVAVSDITGDVSQEVDAYLFTGIAGVQAGGSYYYDIDLLASYPTVDPLTGVNFTTAWSTIMFGNRMNLTDYNTLIDEFQLSHFNTSGATNGAYNSMTANQLPNKTALEADGLALLYDQDYYVLTYTSGGDYRFDDGPGDLPSYIPPIDPPPSYIPSTSYGH